MVDGIDFRMLFLVIIIVMMGVGCWYLYNNMNVVKSKINNLDKVISVLMTPRSDEVVNASTEVLSTVVEEDENIVEE